MRPIALLTALIVSTASVPPTPDTTAVRVMWDGIYKPMVERIIQVIIYEQPVTSDTEPAADLDPGSDDPDTTQPAGPPVPSEQDDDDGSDGPGPDEDGNYAT